MMSSCVLSWVTCFSVSCVETWKAGDPQLGGCGVYWVTIRKTRDAFGLQKTVSFGHWWVRIEGMVESGEWERFWKTHWNQWQPELYFLNLSALTHWASKLDYSPWSWETSHYFFFFKRGKETKLETLKITFLMHLLFWGGFPDFINSFQSHYLFIFECWVKTSPIKLNRIRLSMKKSITFKWGEKSIIQHGDTWSESSSDA